MTVRADLHVHSKYSNRPSEWLLRRLGSPESFMEPLEVYRRAKARGMRFVTLSDHDEIGGALEIAHLPDTFVSCEVTASFPEDGCRIHCLVWGIDEAQHRAIQALRGNVYELRDFLFDERIAHAVAHPLYSVNDRLTLTHFEKLLVLFKTFEARNGIHDGLSNAAMEVIAGSLTPEVIFDLADKHRIDPRDPQPWVKRLTGGSDDHGGVYCGTTWTETPPAATVEDYLEHLRRGEHRPGGERGSVLRLTRSLYTIAWQDYRRRFPRPWQRRHPFARLLRRLAAPAGAVRMLPGALPDASPTADREVFRRADRATRKAMRRTLYSAGIGARRGDPGRVVGSLRHLGEASAAALPFAVALFTQFKHYDLVQSARRQFVPPESRPSPARRAPRKAWVIDDLSRRHPTARTVRRAARSAAAAGRDLTVLTCRAPATDDPAAFPVHCFEPVLKLPVDGRDLHLPAVLEVLDYLERRRFDEVIVSTPGPLGILAAIGARLLGIRLTCVCHRDLPRWARRLTGSTRLEDLSAEALRWFYDRADRVVVGSEALGRGLALRGQDPRRLEVAPPITSRPTAGQAGASRLAHRLAALL